MIWPHLDLQTQLQIQMHFRGLSANLHYMHFEKGSNGQTTITMQFLGRNYPKFIYGMANFEFGQTWQKSKKEQGLICKMAILQILEGPNAKMDLTMLVSSSSYPKTIYGMPLFAKDVQIRFEFEFKFKFELKQKRNGKRKRRKKEKRGLRPSRAGFGRRGPSLCPRPKWAKPMRQRRIK